MSNSMKRSAFDILGVDLSASDDSIKDSYLKLVKQNPPDLKPEQFKKVRKAYDQIVNAEARANYLLFESPSLGLKEYFDTVLTSSNKSEALFAGGLLNDLIKEAVDA